MVANETANLLPPLGEAEFVMFAAGVLVVGALAGEFIARTSRLPRVIGFTLAGWLAVAAGENLSFPLHGTVRVVLDLALALLLFEIGSRVRLRWLRRNPWLLGTSLVEASVAGAAVFFALIAVGTGTVAAAACSVLAIPASAAVAGRVAHELRAEGQVTQRMTALTALNTAIAAFALMGLKWVVLAGDAPDWWDVTQPIAISLVASLALAALLAGSVGLAIRRLDLGSDAAALPVLGLILLAVGTARWLGASPLLVPLLAGILLRNTTQRALIWPRHFGTAGGVLVLMLFFIVGASWSLEALAAGGLAGLALLVARGLFRGAAVVALSRPSHLSLRQGVALAVTLTPLSATALVMLSDLQQTLPEVGRSVAPIILTAVAIMELVGPLAVQLALRFAGEIPTDRATTGERP